VRFAEEAGFLSVRHSAAGVPHWFGENHVRREVGLASAEIGGHATGVRSNDPPRKQTTGLHHLMAGIVHGGTGVVATADERKLVGDPGVPREDLADVDAGSIR